VWYTVPWAFTNFNLSVPDPCIKQLQVFLPSPTAISTGPSHLKTLKLSGEVLPPPCFFYPHLVSHNRIDTLFFHEFDRPFTLVLPVLRHIIIIDELKYCPLSPSVRSIHIELNYDLCIDVMFTLENLLHTLSTLPSLKSLRIVVYDMPFMLDDKICQSIAESVLVLTDFVFCLRREYDEHYDVKKVFHEHRTFIDQLRSRILVLSKDKQPYFIVESDGCGLIMWF